MSTYDCTPTCGGGFSCSPSSTGDGEGVFLFVWALLLVIIYGWPIYVPLALGAIVGALAQSEQAGVLTGVLSGVLLVCVTARRMIRRRQRQDREAAALAAGRQVERVRTAADSVSRIACPRIGRIAAGSAHARCVCHGYAGVVDDAVWRHADEEFRSSFRSSYGKGPRDIDLVIEAWRQAFKLDAWHRTLRDGSLQVSRNDPALWLARGWRQRHAEDAFRKRHSAPYSEEPYKSAMDGGFAAYHQTILTDLSRLTGDGNCDPGQLLELLESHSQMLERYARQCECTLQTAVEGDGTGHTQRLAALRRLSKT